MKVTVSTRALLAALFLSVSAPTMASTLNVIGGNQDNRQQTRESARSSKLNCKAYSNSNGECRETKREYKQDSRKYDKTVRQSDRAYNRDARR